MNGSTSREIIYRNMDAMSLEFDTLDNLIEVKQNINVCINKVTKIINKGKEYNQILEVNTRQRIA